MISKSEKVIREQLAALLLGGQAHMTLDEAVADFPTNKINEIFPNGKYSAYGLLEHIRLTQFDILDFMINPKYKEPEWPKDYWPKTSFKATKKDFDNSVKLFNRDLKKIEKIALTEKDLSRKIPWGSGKTIIREILLDADHNSYEIGEFAIMRQVMGTWPKGRKD